MANIRIRQMLLVCAFALLMPMPERAAGEDRPSYAFYRPPEAETPYPRRPVGEVKNVILLIGDGMGTAQITGARLSASGPDGRLHMDRLPVAGLVTTHAAGGETTDSAAAGTALATGEKTARSVIGMDSKGRKLVTILEAARDKGMFTGLIATSTITHATPAVFGAHVLQRSQEAEIASQLISAKINVLFGGGREFFLPAGRPGSRRQDERDLLAEAGRRGYRLVSTAEELGDARGTHVLGLFAQSALTGKAPEPSLAEMTGKAIDLLAGNEKGFFLMVEGSQIDWRCHANDFEGCVREVLLLDQAVAAAMEFALPRKDTLVIVTADHETGGLVIFGRQGDGSLTCQWAGTGHTLLPVPIFAFGPHAERFGGTMDNTRIPRILADLLGVKIGLRPERTPAQSAAP